MIVCIVTVCFFPACIEQPQRNKNRAFFIFVFRYVLSFSPWKCFHFQIISSWMIWKMDESKKKTKTKTKMSLKNCVSFVVLRWKEINGQWYGSFMHLNNGHAINSITTNCYIKSGLKRHEPKSCEFTRILHTHTHTYILTNAQKQPWSIKALFVSL